METQPHIEQLVSALSCVYSPTSSDQDRLNATQFLDKFKLSPPVSVIDISLSLLCNVEHNTYIRHYGFHCFEYVILTYWNTMSIDERQGIKTRIYQLLTDPQTSFHLVNSYNNDKAIISSQLAKLVASIVLREFPQQWDTIFAQLCTFAEQHASLSHFVFLIEVIVIVMDRVSVATPMLPERRRKEIHGGMVLILPSLFDRILSFSSQILSICMKDMPTITSFTFFTSLLQGCNPQQQHQMLVFTCQHALEKLFQVFTYYITSVQLTEDHCSKLVHLFSRFLTLPYSLHETCNLILLLVERRNVFTSHHEQSVLRLFQSVLDLSMRLCLCQEQWLTTFLEQINQPTGAPDADYKRKEQVLLQQLYDPAFGLLPLTPISTYQKRDDILIKLVKATRLIVSGQSSLMTGLLHRAHGKLSTSEHADECRLMIENVHQTRVATMQLLCRLAKTSPHTYNRTLVYEVLLAILETTSVHLFGVYIASDHMFEKQMIQPVVSELFCIAILYVSDTSTPFDWNSLPSHITGCPPSMLIPSVPAFTSFNARQRFLSFVSSLNDNGTDLNLDTLIRSSSFGIITNITKSAPILTIQSFIHYFHENITNCLNLAEYEFKAYMQHQQDAALDKSAAYKITLFQDQPIFMLQGTVASHNKHVDYSSQASLGFLLQIAPDHLYGSYSFFLSDAYKRLVAMASLSRSIFAAIQTYLAEIQSTILENSQPISSSAPVGTKATKNSANNMNPYDIHSGNSNNEYNRKPPEHHVQEVMHFLAQLHSLLLGCPTNVLTVVYQVATVLTRLVVLYINSPTPQNDLSSSVIYKTISYFLIIAQLNPKSLIIHQDSNPVGTSHFFSQLNTNNVTKIAPEQWVQHQELMDLQLFPADSFVHTNSSLSDITIQNATVDLLYSITPQTPSAVEIHQSLRQQHTQQQQALLQRLVARDQQLAGSHLQWLSLTTSAPLYGEGYEAPPNQTGAVQPSTTAHNYSPLLDLRRHAIHCMLNLTKTITMIFEPFYKQLSSHILSLVETNRALPSEVVCYVEILICLGLFFQDEQLLRGIFNDLILPHVEYLVYNPDVVYFCSSLERFHLLCGGTEQEQAWWVLQQLQWATFNSMHLFHRSAHEHGVAVQPQFAATGHQSDGVPSTMRMISPSILDLRFIAVRHLIIYSFTSIQAYCRLLQARVKLAETLPPPDDDLVKSETELEGSDRQAQAALKKRRKAVSQPKYRFNLDEYLLSFTTASSPTASMSEAQRRRHIIQQVFYQGKLAYNMLAELLKHLYSSCQYRLVLLSLALTDYGTSQLRVSNRSQIISMPTFETYHWLTLVDGYIYHDIHTLSSYYKAPAAGAASSSQASEMSPHSPLLGKFAMLTDQHAVDKVYERILHQLHQHGHHSAPSNYQSHASLLDNLLYSIDNILLDTTSGSTYSEFLTQSQHTFCQTYTQTVTLQPSTSTTSTSQGSISTDITQDVIRKCSGGMTAVSAADKVSSMSRNIWTFTENVYESLAQIVALLPVMLIRRTNEDLLSEISNVQSFGQTTRQELLPFHIAQFSQHQQHGLFDSQPSHMSATALVSPVPPTMTTHLNTISQRGSPTPECSYWLPMIEIVPLLDLVKQRLFMTRIFPVIFACIQKQHFFKLFPVLYAKTSRVALNSLEDLYLHYRFAYNNGNGNGSLGVNHQNADDVNPINDVMLMIQSPLLSQLGDAIGMTVCARLKRLRGANMHVNNTVTSTWSLSLPYLPSATQLITFPSLNVLTTDGIPDSSATPAFACLSRLDTELSSFLPRLTPLSPQMGPDQAVSSPLHLSSMASIYLECLQRCLSVLWSQFLSNEIGKEVIASRANAQQSTGSETQGGSSGSILSFEELTVLDLIPRVLSRYDLTRFTLLSSRQQPQQQQRLLQLFTTFLQQLASNPSLVGALLKSYFKLFPSSMLGLLIAPPSRQSSAVPPNGHLSVTIAQFQCDFIQLIRRKLQLLESQHARILHLQQRDNAGLTFMATTATSAASQGGNAGGQNATAVARSSLEGGLATLPSFNIDAIDGNDTSSFIKSVVTTMFKTLMSSSRHNFSMVHNERLMTNAINSMIKRTTMMFILPLRSYILESGIFNREFLYNLFAKFRGITNLNDRSNLTDVCQELSILLQYISIVLVFSRFNLIYQLPINEVTLGLAARANYYKSDGDDDYDSSIALGKSSFHPIPDHGDLITNMDSFWESVIGPPMQQDSVLALQTLFTEHYDMLNSFCLDLLKYCVYILYRHCYATYQQQQHQALGGLSSLTTSEQKITVSGIKTTTFCSPILSISSGIAAVSTDTPLNANAITAVSTGVTLSDADVLFDLIRDIIALVTFDPGLIQAAVTAIESNAISTSKTIAEVATPPSPPNPTHPHISNQFQQVAQIFSAFPSISQEDILVIFHYAQRLDATQDGVPEHPKKVTSSTAQSPQMRPIPPIPPQSRQAKTEFRMLVLSLFMKSIQLQAGVTSSGSSHSVSSGIVNLDLPFIHSDYKQSTSQAMPAQVNFDKLFQ